MQPELKSDNSPLRGSGVRHSITCQPRQGALTLLIVDKIIWTEQIMVRFDHLPVRLLSILPPSSLTYLHPSPSFSMSTSSASRKKKASTTTIKPAKSGTRAPRDINLSEGPQNILPEDTRRAKKGSDKQIAIGEYDISPIRPFSMYCIQTPRKDRSSLLRCRRRSRSFKRLIDSRKKVTIIYMFDP